LTLRIGTSGWSYRDWKGAFYPEGVPSREYLHFYARRFPAVEVDSSFYAAPARTTLQHWLEAAPPGFRFVLKVPRSITHEGRLDENAEELARFLDLLSLLGERRGPALLQLPPSFTRSRLSELFRLLEELPIRPGLSVEFRHPSCFAPEAFEEVRERGVGLVTSEAHSGLLLSGPDVILRLLGKRDAVESFDRVVFDRGADLDLWAERLRQLPDWVENTYVFLGNNFSGHAPATALGLGVRLGVLERPEDPGQQASLFG
jgi:uncharacterized protein YecE (DUF72 family)